MKSYADVSKGGRDLREPLKVVVFREPLSQLVSLYDYIKHGKRHLCYDKFWELYGGESLNSHLIKMMDDIEKNGNTTTEATRRLWKITHSQMDFLSGEDFFLRGKTCEILIYDSIYGFNNASGSLNSYQNALLHLERFHVIATLKTIDSSLLPQLKYWLSWADQNITKVLTINSIAQNLKKGDFVKSVISKDTAERMKKNFVKYDYRLYNRAVELDHESLEFVKKKRPS
eukprot:CAMPEP_0194271032 /NCGR_PEP_ID=MMETSP0169-20130528/4927_1 /TAXON_ID=218684 /ORGANISM="Corethron pennatum, Strain L29A3" /LENGTH=228 /DNA_ID=CAMNT_0039013297 /DNA_START=651 /DNA_END=1337 /DNA_ORIENTATION=-